MSIPTPPEVLDPARLAALRRTGLLDTPAEAVFDQLTALACGLIGTPISLISLVTADRQFLKSSLGLPEPWNSRRETPLSHSYCQVVVATGALLTIPDARRSARFRESLALRDLKAVSYAGVPLRTADGFVLGSLCVIDRRPRRWMDRQLTILEQLGRLAESLIGAETEAIGSTRRLHAILDSALDAIITIDPSGTITDWRSQATNIFGWTSAEAVGRPLTETIIPPQHREAHRRGMERFLTTGVGPILGNRIEITALRKNGQEFPVELTVSAVQLEEGWQFTAFLRDLSARSQAERVQRATYRIAQAAAASVGLAELLADIHTAVSELMPATNFYVALVDEEAGLLSFPYYIDERSPPSPPRPLGRGLTEYVLRTGCSQLVTPNVHQRLVESGEVERVGAPALDWLGVPLRPRDRAIGVLVVQSYTGGVRYGEAEKEILEFVSTQIAMAIDRKRTEELRRQSEIKYRLLFEANPESLWVFDAETLRFLAVNDAAIRKYGWSREEFMAMTILEVRPPSERDRIERIVRNPLPAPELRTGLRHWTKDHVVFDVEVMVDSMEFGGRPARLTMVRDVTERKRLEGQLQQSQRMEAVGRLAGGVAHDFNNLLTAVMGYSDLLIEGLPADDGRRDDLEEIRKATRRGAALTQQLLAYSRRQVLQPRVIDLNAVVTGTQRLLHRLIGEHIELRAELDPGLGAVRADPAQLEQVIINLAVNARDAMPRGGQLLITTQNVLVTDADAVTRPLVASGSYVQLTVTDTGTGFDEQVLSRLFEPFFTTKGPGKGTGLGLSTVYGIVQQSGGTIDAVSTVGQGSTFTVLLPRVEAVPDGAPAVAPPVAPAAGTETILLVEDEAALRAVARRSLEGQGYRILEASDGEMALALTAAHVDRIDLLVTDVVMPGMHGREVATRIVAQRPGIRVLYMSGYTNDAIVHLGVLDPGVAFLQKPFSPDALRRKVREVLDA